MTKFRIMIFPEKSESFQIVVDSLDLVTEVVIYYQNDNCNTKVYSFESEEQ